MCIAGLKKERNAPKQHKNIDFRQNPHCVCSVWEALLSCSLGFTYHLPAQHCPLCLSCYTQTCIHSNLEPTRLRELHAVIGTCCLPVVKPKYSPIYPHLPTPKNVGFKFIMLCFVILNLFIILNQGEKFPSCFYKFC